MSKNKKFTVTYTRGVDSALLWKLVEGEIRKQSIYEPKLNEVRKIDWAIVEAACFDHFMEMDPEKDENKFNTLFTQIRRAEIIADQNHENAVDYIESSILELTALLDGDYLKTDTARQGVIVTLDYLNCLKRIK